jgi:hypothetical protein
MVLAPFFENEKTTGMDPVVNEPIMYSIFAVVAAMPFSAPPCFLGTFCAATAASKKIRGVKVAPEQENCFILGR